MNTDLLAGIIVTALLVLALAITLGSLFADRTPAPAPYTSPSDRLRPMRNNATAECNVAAQGQAPTEAEWVETYNKHFPGACGGACREEGCEECGCHMVLDGIEEGRARESYAAAAELIRTTPIYAPDDWLADMAVEARTGPLAFYGTRVVHRLCLTARRDGRQPCATCAPVMTGAS